MYNRDHSDLAVDRDCKRGTAPLPVTQPARRCPGGHLVRPSDTPTLISSDMTQSLGSDGSTQVCPKLCLHKEVSASLSPCMCGMTRLHPSTDHACTIDLFSLNPQPVIYDTHSVLTMANNLFGQHNITRQYQGVHRSI